MLPLGDSYTFDFSRSSQFTLATSRLTAYILLIYYLIFTYFGEVFLLTSLGLTSPLEMVHSSNFFSIKSHIFMSTSSYSLYSLDQFSSAVKVLSITALLWLLLLNSHNSYQHLRWHFFGAIPLVYLSALIGLYLYF